MQLEPHCHSSLPVRLLGYTSYFWLAQIHIIIKLIQKMGVILTRALPDDNTWATHVQCPQYADQSLITMDKDSTGDPPADSQEGVGGV